MTVDKELKAGKVTAHISQNGDRKLKLELDWKWLETKDKGKSTYIEI